MNTEKYSHDDKADQKFQLTEIQYAVTQQNATEPPFRNRYWDNKDPGIYVDIVSGEPLFSSLDKFDSGTGWPSFIRPLEEGNIIYKKDRTLSTVRTEVRSRHGNSHLGHVFEDGPQPTGKRYCINSASLRFIPVEHLKEQGYEQYLPLFTAGSESEDQNPVARGDSHTCNKNPQQHEIAIFAAGCFWGVEEILRKIDGVICTTVGYIGGTTENPTYTQVCTGATGHAEAVRLKFNREVISYSTLLDYFFRLHNPTTLNRQGNDRGTQYRSAVFYTSEEQRRLAEKKKRELNESGTWNNQVITEIVPAGEFYPAEEYHQNYLQKKSPKL